MAAVQFRLKLQTHRAAQPARGEEAVIECCDNLPFMQSLAPESIKLVVTSPPYNLGKEYERRPVRALTRHATASIYPASQ